MKPITRCSSKNIWRDSSSEGEREYVVLRGGEAPSSSLIFRLCSQCGASIDALLLLKTSAKLWYSGGTLERSANTDVVEAEWRSLFFGQS